MWWSIMQNIQNDGFCPCTTIPPAFKDDVWFLKYKDFQPIKIQGHYVYNNVLFMVLEDRVSSESGEGKNDDHFD
jgi:hypothetical protein